MHAETFFSEEEKKAIAETIGAVEQTTAGEVAVMVVEQSDTYPEGRILAGILLGGLISLVVTDLFFHASLWVFLPLTILSSLFLGWGVKYFPAAMRVFIPVSHLEAQVQERAVRAFYEKGLFRTRDASGVLFFLSLFEHKVWILADKGIYAKIRPEELQEYAAVVARGVKQGRAAEVLCAEIRKVGKILAAHFPVRQDDTNELTNQVLTE